MSNSEATGIHSTAEKAVAFMWNNQYVEAQDTLSEKKGEHPRYALEWANITLVRTLMSSTNEDRESLLVLFQADRILRICVWRRRT